MNTETSPRTAFGDLDRIERSLHDAAKRTAGHPAGWAQLAIHLSNKGEPRRAVAVLWEAVAACGDNPALLQAIADLLIDAPGHPDRLEALARTANALPDNLMAQVNFGLSALLAPNPAGALRPLRRAVELGEERIDVLLSIASAELQMGSFEAAIALFDRVLALEPDNPTAIVERWFASLTTCDWPGALALEPAVEHVFSRCSPSDVSPLRALALPTKDPAQLRHYVEHGARAHLPGRGLRHAGQSTTNRIRVGYLSADFHDHAIARLSRGLFGAHAPDQFEVFAYSYGPRSAAVVAADIEASVEHWHNIAEVDDDAAVALIRSHKIDVLIEMKGHTAGARPEISRQRVAPVQMHYLGCPGPVGGFGIDFFVADDITVPLGAESEFNVPVVRLPRAYQVNDSRRAVPVAVTRTSVGVSEDTLLLGNFNQLWKIRPEFMAIWCRALRSCPRASLWLLEPSESTRSRVEANLNAWLSNAGFEDVADRVVFVQRLPNEAHMNRLATVDLIVDQLPYGSHTTASDALWAAVPLLTVAGNTFAGRVASSLLTTHGEDSFITPNKEAYEARLLELLSAPQQLAAAKTRLAAKRSTSPLFDTAGFVRDWEALLTTVYAENARAFHVE